MTNYKSYFFTKEKRSDSYFAIYWIIIVSSCFTNTFQGTVNIYKVVCFDSNIILATLVHLLIIFHCGIFEPREKEEIVRIKRFSRYKNRQDLSHCSPENRQDLSHCSPEKRQDLSHCSPEKKTRSISL